ncbi:hypothetical protein LTR85_002760 [Meristemomyces frigidus]|nr:hypothetical protein LTR85_002760 [Meristemomyces frigidus]
MSGEISRLQSPTKSAQTLTIGQDSKKRGFMDLPREPRDQIYGYLLYHEHIKAAPYRERSASTRSQHSTKTMRDRSAAHTFRFRPDILSTNHQIQQEAGEILASNKFVLVSFEYDDLEAAKHAHGLPVVCEDHEAVKRFKHHLLRVHIKSASKRTRTKGMQLFLMLACTTLFHPRDSAPHRLVAVDWNQGKKSPPVTATLRLRSTNFKPMTVALQSQLLKPFQDMIAISQKVTVMSSLPAPAHAQALAQLMGPQMAFLQPVAWRAVAVAQAIKSRAHELVAAGDLQTAADRYDLLVNSQISCPLFYLPLRAYNSDGEVAIALLQRIILDAAVTEGFLLLRMSQFADALAITHEIAAMMDSMNSLPSQELVLPESGRFLTCWQTAYWQRILVSFLAQRDGPDLLDNAKSLQRVCEDVSDLELARSMQHDAALMSQTVHNANAFQNYARRITSNEQLVQMMSTGQFGPLVINTPLLCTKPDGMRGFIDHQDYESYVAANPQLGLVARQEIERMFSTLDQ